MANLDDIRMGDTRTLVDYELKDGLPTPGELTSGYKLKEINRENQRPLNSNCHSIFNLRHYLENGGRIDIVKQDGVQKAILIKGPWVEVYNGYYRCTLCKRRNGGGHPACNDGHFQSEQHQKKVRAWSLRLAGKSGQPT